MGNEDNNRDLEYYQTWSCCNDEQTLFILLYIAYAAVAVITWNTVLAKPVRLIAVFIHEWSHAIACWLTGGDVRKIEVYDNEGGVTTFVGGCRCLIIPAGYVGCSFSAMIFVILSGGRGTATFACIAFTLSLIVALFYSPNRTLVYLCAAYTVINVTVFILEYTTWLYSPILQFLILFYGVFVGIYAIADIYDDTVIRDIRGSDANACASQVWPCCPPQCIGLQWAFLAICFQFFGIWVAMVELSQECENLGWFECLNLSVDFGDFNIKERNWEWEGFWHQGMETIRWQDDVPWKN
jgi:Peptidase M50B-like